MSKSAPLQVVCFRGLCGVEVDRACVQLDAAGLKRLFSHGIRRFTSGATNKALGFRKDFTAPHVLKPRNKKLTNQRGFHSPFSQDEELDEFYNVLRTYWAEAEGTGDRQEESEDGYGAGADDGGDVADPDDPADEPADEPASPMPLAEPVLVPSSPMPPAEPAPVPVVAAATEATSPASIPEKISPGSSTDRASPASSADRAGTTEAPSKDSMPPPPVPVKPGVKALVQLRIKELELLSLPINLPFST